MRLRKISTVDRGRVLLLHLLIVGAFARASTRVVVETHREETPAAGGGQPLPAREDTTNVSLPNVLPTVVAPTANDRKLTSPIAVVENPPCNRSDAFRPSVHLGEIKETPTIKTTPFNNVQHVKFESNVRPDATHERYHDVRQDAAYQSVGSVLDEATRPSRIKFEDERIVQTPSSVHYAFGDDQRVVETDGSSSVSSTSPFEETGVKHVFVDQQTFYQNVPESPEDAQNDASIYGGQLPTGDHRLNAGSYYDASRLPYVTYYADNNQNAYRPLPQDTTYEMTKRPDGDILLLQQHESTYTRKRKFPYQFYQPVGEYHDVEFVEEPRQSATVVAYPPMRKLSPWKKFVHLIGAFLPLGLLLATLTPKIVRIDNSTQPNIVLSKLRVADLPVEHKRARMLDDQPAVCEDRLICKLIVAGSEPGSNVLQNILWNLVTRIPDDVAERSGLRGVFNAVKNKDCTIITC